MAFFYFFKTQKWVFGLNSLTLITPVMLRLNFDKKIIHFCRNQRKKNLTCTESTVRCIDLNALSFNKLVYLR